MTRKELKVLIESITEQAYKAGRYPSKRSDADLERSEKRLIEILAKELGIQMTKRKVKTIEVRTIRDEINLKIQLSKNTDTQITLCSLLERILMDTGNYNGFGWNLDAGIADDPDFKEGHPGYYNRHYY